IHHLGRDRRHPALLCHSLYLFASHGPDEIRNVLKPFLSLRGPRHPITRITLGIIHYLQCDCLISLLASKGLHAALHQRFHKWGKAVQLLLLFGRQGEFHSRRSGIAGLTARGKPHLGHHRGERTTTRFLSSLGRRPRGCGDRWPTLRWLVYSWGCLTASR